MKAKLIREIPQREGLPCYFKTYEYECIECGAHYTRHQYNERISPYCCKCNAKYEKQRQKECVARHEQKIINAVLDKIRAEIETKYGHCDICEYFEDYDYEENDISEYRPIGNIADILQIVDKYKAGRR